MKKNRARDLGIPFEGNTGKFNAITDELGRDKQIQAYRSHLGM